MSRYIPLPRSGSSQAVLFNDEGKLASWELPSNQKLLVLGRGVDNLCVYVWELPVWESRRRTWVHGGCRAAACARALAPPRGMKKCILQHLKLEQSVKLSNFLHRIRCNRIPLLIQILRQLSHQLSRWLSSMQPSPQATSPLRRRLPSRTRSCPPMHLAPVQWQTSSMASLMAAKSKAFCPQNRWQPAPKRSPPKRNRKGDQQQQREGERPCAACHQQRRSHSLSPRLTPCLSRLCPSLDSVAKYLSMSATSGPG